MPDIGEEIVGTWLKEVARCEFVEYGVKTQHQGEIDVVGLSLENDRAYICEAATHVHGLWYGDTTNANALKLVDKFARAIGWAEQHLRRFPSRTYMLWTPVVKGSRLNARLDQAKSVQRAKQQIRERFDIDLEVVSNKSYKEKLAELRAIALKTTSNPSSPVLRLMQIEQWNKKQLGTAE